MYANIFANVYIKRLEKTQIALVFEPQKTKKQMKRCNENKQINAALFHYSLHKCNAF